jgi:hypothetical protein
VISALSREQQARNCDPRAHNCRMLLSAALNLFIARSALSKVLHFFE